MSSVSLDGKNWYKRCAKCGEYTHYDNLMYIPPTKPFDRETFDNMDHMSKEFSQYCADVFGLDVCAACAIEHKNAYRSPTMEVSL